eukprot:6834726-Pyramimonas_sp.AAC.1
MCPDCTSHPRLDRVTSGGFFEVNCNEDMARLSPCSNARSTIPMTQSPCDFPPCLAAQAASWKAMKI